MLKNRVYNKIKNLSNTTAAVMPLVIKKRTTNISHLGSTILIFNQMYTMILKPVQIQVIKIEKKIIIKLL